MFGLPPKIGLSSSLIPIEILSLIQDDDTLESGLNTAEMGTSNDIRISTPQQSDSALQQPNSLDKDISDWAGVLQAMETNTDIQLNVLNVLETEDVPNQPTSSDVEFHDTDVQMYDFETSMEKHTDIRINLSNILDTEVDTLDQSPTSSDVVAQETDIQMSDLESGKFNKPYFGFIKRTK